VTRSWVVQLPADDNGEFTPSGMDGAEDMGDTYDSAAEAEADRAQILAEGAKPRPPTRPAHRSETISPWRLVSTTTSNVSGRVTNFIQRSSTMTSSDFNSGYSLLLHKNIPGITHLLFHDISFMTTGNPFCIFLFCHFKCIFNHLQTSGTCYKATT